MPLPVLFGADVDPLSLPVGRSLLQATLIDRLGLHLLTIQDHPCQHAFTGARADGRLPSYTYLGLDELLAAVARIDAAAADAGRDPAGPRKVYNIAGRVSAVSSATFDEPVGAWVERLVDLVTQVGMNGFVLWPLDDHERQYAVFAEEVAPAVRAALAGSALG